MAPAYGCQLQGEGENHQVSWLITHLNPAGTISLCDEDFAIGVIHLLATDLGADPERLYAALERFVKAEAARQAKEADARARKTPWPQYDGAPASCVCGAQPDEFGGLQHIGDGPHEPVEIEVTK